MRPRLHIELVTTQAREDAAAEFLAGFGCQLHEGHRPIRIIRRGQDFIGVSQVLTAPLHLTCWSPDRSHRDIIEGINSLRMMGEGYTPGGVSYCTAHDNGQPFTAEILAKLGFQDTGLRVFVSKPD
mgnify:CR=1 FL=1